MTMLDYWLVGTATVHQGYMPEIRILSATTASGIWAMNDHHHAPTGPNWDSANSRDRVTTTRLTSSSRENG